MTAASQALGPGSHAILWERGAMVDLGVLPGTDRSGAYGTNAAGQIVGDGGNTPGTRALLWARGVLHDLGTLPGHTTSAALAINAAGQVVGYAFTPPDPPNGGHAVLWQNGTPLDLNELIPPNSGWALRVAAEINEAGQIAGVGTIGGRQRAYLLTPIAPLGLPRTGSANPGGRPSAAGTLGAPSLAVPGAGAHASARRTRRGLSWERSP